LNKKNIPNVLTFLRIVSVPFFIYFLLCDSNYIFASFIFIIASVTDFLDGYFARKFNAISNFGTFFDPLADKLLVISCFVSFLYIELLQESVLLWMIVVIVFRDVSITLLRLLIQSKNMTMITTKVAKAKTAFQMGSIGLILFYLTLIQSQYLILEYIQFNLIIFYLMTATALVTLYTGIHYYYNNSHLLIKVFSKE
tara:strand:+ start:571 stop:1161 length:591 start_codon:yes stop_codon:yes gene_type:complete